jgi:uncharacterized protein (DUF1697 family)
MVEPRNMDARGHMPRYVAFLRGVSPLNAKMPELKRCFESAGFTKVVTVLSSGNVIFDAPTSKESTLERKAEDAMQKQLGRSFYTIIRSVRHLEKLLVTDPYAEFNVAPAAKRVVSFFRQPRVSKQILPLEADGARVLCVVEREVFTAYIPNEKGPIFMSLIEKAFGTDVTTRTWQTVVKSAAA